MEEATHTYCIIIGVIRPADVTHNLLNLRQWH